MTALSDKKTEWQPSASIKTYWRVPKSLRISASFLLNVDY